MTQLQVLFGDIFRLRKEIIHSRRIRHFVKAPKMEGTVRFLLLTLLANAATAIFEYDHYLVVSNIASLLQLPTVRYQLHNTGAGVHWHVAPKIGENILFKANPEMYMSPEFHCNRKPALTLDEGPMAGRMLCLAQMNFMTTTIGNNQQLNLVLGFVDSGNPDNLIPVFFDLLKKPSNEVQLFPGVVEAVPINELEALSASVLQTFVGSTPWLDNMFGRGIHELPLLPEQQIGIQPMLKGYPIVMDAEILDRILAL